MLRRLLNVGMETQEETIKVEHTFSLVLKFATLLMVFRAFILLVRLHRSEFLPSTR